jgi:hypothetical protein
MEAKYLKYKQKYLLARHTFGGADGLDSDGDVNMTDADELREAGNIVPLPPRTQDRYGIDVLPRNPAPLPDGDNNYHPPQQDLNRQLPRPGAPPIPRLARQFAERVPPEPHQPPVELYPGARDPEAGQVGQDQRGILTEGVVRNIIRQLIDDIPEGIPDDLRNRIPAHIWNHLIHVFPNWPTMDRIGISHIITRIIRDFLAQHLHPPQV